MTEDPTLDILNITTWDAFKRWAGVSGGVRDGSKRLGSAWLAWKQLPRSERETHVAFAALGDARGRAGWPRD